MILNLTEFEINFLHFLRNISNTFLDHLFEAITFLGEQYCIIIILVILYYGISKKIGQRVLYSIITTINLNNIFKLIIKRERPFSQVQKNPVTPARPETATGYSFPSGHTQNASVTYTSLAINFRKKQVIIPCIILIILIGFSRLWLGVHFPTDVIAGCILGVGFAFLLNYIHSKVEENTKKKYLLYLVTSLLLLPFIVSFYVYYKTNDCLYVQYKDTFVSYGLLLGAFSGIILEEKTVNFSDTTSRSLKIKRCLFGFVFTIGCYLITSFIFKAIIKDCVELDLIRYFLVSFTALGLYPIICKKWLFD